MLKKPIVVSVVILLSIIPLLNDNVSPAKADNPQYTITDIGSLPSKNSAEATSLNDNGQIVGVSYNCCPDNNSHAFVYENGTMTDLGSSVGDTYASGNNNNGQIVGWNPRAVIWENNILHQLDTAGSVAYNINNNGQAVGGRIGSDGEMHGYAWMNGVGTELSSNIGRAVSNNDAGLIVGYANFGGFTEAQPALWEDGSIINLGSLGGDYPGMQASDINNKNQIVGQAKTATGYMHAFIWQEDVLTDLGTLGGLESSAWGINDDGVIIGVSSDTNGKSLPVIWKNGQIQELPVPNNNEIFVTDINNKGQIVGYSNVGFNQPNHAYLWTPIVTASSSPSSTSSPTTTATASPTPIPTPTSSPTSTQQPTATHTSTPTPTATFTPTPSPTPTIKPTTTPKPTKPAFPTPPTRNDILEFLRDLFSRLLRR